MSRKPRKLFQAQRRTRLFGWLLAPAVGLTALLIFSQRPTAPPMAQGLGQPLVWQTAGQLPKWARQALSGRVADPRSQIVVAVADLNRDRSPELLIAPAPSRHDVFVPASRLRVLHRGTDGWLVSAAALSCRPMRLGGFLTNGYWNLPCRSGALPVGLRWSGSHYQTAARPDPGPPS